MMKQQNDDVFFILGSVRSGTTLLRDLLKQHPNLVCPEETHIFRWAEPFNSTDYNHVCTHAEVLQMHRGIDNVSEETYANSLAQTRDRGEFIQDYFKHFKQAQGNPTARCFDKTPQNVYGLPLIKAYFPNAKIVHIIRNPLNVVSSLRKGRGLSAQNLIGAINFWKESILILNTLKPILGDNLYELKYEDLTNNPQQEYANLLAFLGEDAFYDDSITQQVNPAKNLYLEELTSEEIQLVTSELQDLSQPYGYL